MFCFSAFAVEEKATVTFHPRVLRHKDFHEAESGGGEQKIKTDGKENLIVPGEKASGLRYKLYRISNEQVEQYIDFKNGKLKDGVNVFNFKFDGPKYTVDIIDGVGSVEIPEANYGYYYVEMEDTANQGRTCEPFVISVPVTDRDRVFVNNGVDNAENMFDNGKENKDAHIYPKVTLKTHKVNIKKLVNGLRLKDDNQSPRIKGNNFVMKFKLQRKNANGYWQKCFNDHEFETDGAGLGICDMPDLISGEYRIEETAFEAIDGDNHVNILNNKMFKKTTEQGKSFFEFTLDGSNQDDNVKTVEVNNVMRSQISKYIMNNNMKCLTFGVKPGDYINYKLDVDKPYIEDQANMSVEQIKNALNALQYFYVVDNMRNNAMLIDENCDIRNDLVVNFVDGNGVSTQLTRDQDYTINIGDRLNFSVDLTNNGNVSDRVANLIYNSREDNRAHFEISFKVKTKNQSSLNDVLVGLRDAIGQHDENALLNRLSIVNSAKVMTDGAELISNKVRSQFGILNINKKNEKGEALAGAEFELQDENGVRYHDRAIGENNKDQNNVTSDAAGHADFVVPIGANIQFDERKDYLWHSEIVGNNNALVDKNIEDNFGAEALRDPSIAKKYKVKEVQAPEGYEVIGKRFDMTMDAVIKSIDIKNYPTVELPFTGGMGTILFTVVGILLIGSGAFLYMNSRRKKSAE